ncbi:P-II family nitrogen regulator [Methylocystis bryophila]|uniref:Nitrogen regulatory protein P-II n=1 Tax=Methylocystis bryophila TaxID=655015 RepID=A0A1W6MYC8_9HYPH|nr:P-II family nitrogen regulator [Methylocystis bryophila]ARN82600.1 transcriptional regulator [Methylocystis bryophila]BDV38814.1 nitrogen regulatory protein P-II 1 [Methylocystis bryophila]
MKVVVAIIKPFKLTDVHDALHAIGVHGLTVYEAKGHGHQKGHSEIYRSVEYVAHYLSKLRVEVIVADERVDKVVATISTAARTGQTGDGKIFIQAIEKVVRIRNGEADEAAL